MITGISKVKSMALSPRWDFRRYLQNLGQSEANRTVL